MLTYHNELDDQLPEYTVQSWPDGYWVDLNVGKTGMRPQNRWILTILANLRTVCISSGKESLAEYPSVIYIAELLVYEPRTHSIGVGVNLILTVGDSQQVTIDLARINVEY